MSDIRAAEEALGPEIDDILGEEAPQEEQDASEAESQQDAEEALADEIEADLAAEEGDAEEEAPEEGAPEEPETPLPLSWSKDDAKTWAELTPQARAKVAQREAERDSYLRRVGSEAAQVKQAAQTEAREALAQMQERHAAALREYAQQFVSQPPDERLLYTGNPDDYITYQRQMAAHQRSVAQQQELHQRIEQAQATADSARAQNAQSEIAAGQAILAERLPEWNDPQKRQEILNGFVQTATELGYPPEAIKSANASDILAVKTAMDWREKAAKYDALQKKKMESVRAAKSLPRMVKPGVKPSAKQTSAQASEQAWKAAKSGDMNAMADFLGI